MLQNLSSVGPPLQDLPSWNSSKPGRSEEDTESFERTLSENMSSKDSQTETSRRNESPQGVSKAERSERLEKKTQRQDDNQEADVKRATAPATNPLEKKAALARQKAIAEFMDSFESEFGIPPTRLVEAMAQLPAYQLTQYPEDTADAVLAQLDLTEEQEVRAKEMYLTLVSDLSRIDKSMATPKLVAMDPGAVLNNQTQERFMAIQERKNLLNKSLDQMNNKFWLKGQPQPQPLQGQVQAQTMNSAPGNEALPMRVDSMSQPDMMTEMDLQDPNMLPPEKFQEPVRSRPIPGGPIGGMHSQSGSEASKDILAELKKMAQEQNSPQPLPMKPMNSLQMDQTQMMSETPMQDSASEFGMQKFQMKSEAPVPMQSQLEEAVTGMQGRNPQMNNQGEGFLGQNSGQKESQGPSSSVKPSVDSAFVDAMKTPEAMPHPSLHRAESMNAPQTFAPTPVVAAGGPVENEANVRQIMNQAQYLIKKGGGEMKVEMSPEGLGSLHMKVIVNEGKVNVQMAAETKEAKQAIESGLSDLKSSLAAHKLSVDQVKIDVVNSTSTDNSAQNSQSQTPKDGGTRQFWQQFQDSFGNRSQKDSFLETPQLKGYSQKKRDPLAPIESETRTNRKAEGKGNGLDLVA